jgi:Flp pilus assembly CpaF family ATPase
MLFHTQKKEVERPGFVRTLLNIATITSTTITCISLCSLGIFSTKTALIVILIVVIFVALGNNAAKIILACIALVLFMLINGGGTSEGFNTILNSMASLIAVLVVIYFIIRNVFGAK